VRARSHVLWMHFRRYQKHVMAMLTDAPYDRDELLLWSPRSSSHRMTYLSRSAHCARRLIGSHSRIAVGVRLPGFSRSRIYFKARFLTNGRLIVEWTELERARAMAQ
jgi:hypothetical protein